MYIQMPVTVRKKRPAWKRVVARGKTVKAVRRKRRAMRASRVPFRTNIPDTMRVALKYTEPINYSLAVGNAYTFFYTFRLNDCYDPNFSGGGHQPMFRDQWYSLYEYARCLGFKFQLTVYTDSDVPIDVHLVPTSSSTTIAFEQALETKQCQTRTIQKYKPCVLRFNGFVDRFLGNRKGTYLTDDTFKQPVSAALPDKATCFMQFGAISRASATSTIYMRVQHVQFLSFTEPLYQNLS